MNPPFCRETKKWIQKAITESRKGAVVVCLLQSGTGRHYWHNLVFPWAAQIRWVKGMLTFEGAPSTAPFASVIVIFDTKHKYKDKYIYNIPNKEKKQ